MEEKKEGSKPARRWVLFGTAGVLGAVVLFWAAVCIRGSRGAIPPHTAVTVQGMEGTVAVGGLLPREAQEKVARRLEQAGYRGVSVVCGGEEMDLPGELFTLREDALFDALAAKGSEGNFMERGARYAAALLERGKIWPLVWSYRDREGADTRLEELAAAVAVAPVETVWIREGDVLLVTLGAPGRELDIEGTARAALVSLGRGESRVAVEPVTVHPRPVTAEEVEADIYVEANAIPTDGEGNYLPPVTGVSIHVESAREALEGGAPGETVILPLVYTRPDYSVMAEAGLLYRDVLSQCTTSIGGSGNRLTNVTLAAQKCDGVVLLPGDPFDYNQVVGERTAAAGFRSAPAYSRGQTVQEIGGGICQVSSSLYYCAVYANLEIVTRQNHRYAVGYIADGLDATVSWGGPEFVFRNDSLYPVKIDTRVEGRKLTVTCYGTNLTGVYVKTERKQLSQTDYKVVYRPDESVTPGTTVESVTPYTGRQVQVWRCVYDADGTLLSRTTENVSRYSSRDRVVLFHPGDAASLGLNPDGTPIE